eukprot:2862645-Rhodomonas_salina.3
MPWPYHPMQQRRSSYAVSSIILRTLRPVSPCPMSGCMRLAVVLQNARYYPTVPPYAMPGTDQSHVATRWTATDSLYGSR